MFTWADMGPADAVSRTAARIDTPSFLIFATPKGTKVNSRPGSQFRSVGSEQVAGMPLCVLSGADKVQSHPMEPGHLLRSRRPPVPPSRVLGALFLPAYPRHTVPRSA